MESGYPASAGRALMPFPGDVHAALIVSAGEDVTVFFVVHSAPFETMIEGEYLGLPDQWVAKGEVLSLINDSQMVTRTGRCSTWRANGGAQYPDCRSPAANQRTDVSMTCRKCLMIWSGIVIGMGWNSRRTSTNSSRSRSCSNSPKKSHGRL